MVEYLKEYGSYQQQKLAIAEEYAQKIADVEASEADEATKQWQKRKLNKERLQKEASLTFENISHGIDWHALFSGVGDLTKEMMVPMMEQLQAFVKTDDYRNADAETQQKVTELIQEMRKYVGTDQSVTWQTLDKAIKDFTAAVADYDNAKKEEDAAVRARDNGKKRLDAGEITAEEYKALEQRAQELGDATADARDNMEAFGNALNRTSEEVANFTSGLTTALNNAKGWEGTDGFGGVKSAVGNIDKLKGTLDELLPQMGDGMAKTIGVKLSGAIGSTLGSLGSGIEGLLSSGIGSIIGIVAQIPKLILDLANGIKNFVTGILDSLTELISLRWIDDLVVSILDAVGNLIDAIFDLPENLYHVLESIVVNGVGGLLDGVIGRIGNILTFGALSSSVSDWFTNSNAAEVAETIDRLTKRNELLEQAIEDLTDEMKTARGASAIDASKRARELQEETNANYKAIAQAQAGYHDAHHSFNYYWSNFSQEQIARLSQQIGRQWNGDLWDLSPEEMKMLRSNVDMWRHIQDTGKGGYGGRVADKLNDYIDQAGKLQEITDALYETLTTTTKDNVFDDFLNSLYELADGSEDVMDDIADNWQKMVNRMAVNNLVGAKFQKDLEGWYENLAKLNEARTNGEITDEEYRQRLDALKAEYEGYVNNAKRDIETLRSEGIIKATEENSGVTQSGKAGAFTTMSQDQGTKLEGLFVSGQMHWASMDDKLTDVSQQIGAAGDTLKRIEEHTGKSAASLEKIEEDIKIIKRDGLKVK
ncbi:MAG: SHOCT domain-containing protein [Prevotella sp.]|nr:SHOCT domain-containing protein [Prevotella sp.]